MRTFSHPVSPKNQLRRLTHDEQRLLGRTSIITAPTTGCRVRLITAYRRIEDLVRLRSDDRYDNRRDQYQYKNNRRNKNERFPASRAITDARAQPRTRRAVTATNCQADNGAKD